MADSALLSKLKPSRNLTDELVRRLRTEIISGRLAPGERLPTERKLMESLAVSRTVVREAISALRAEGLIVTRQGSGAFVANVIRHTFRIDASGFRSLDDVLSVMEVRHALELQAAVLAASRRTQRDLTRIALALDAFDAGIENGSLLIEEDLEFHCAVAGASGNSLFEDLIRTLGDAAIPRKTVRGGIIDDDAARKEYLRIVNQEHRDLYLAVRAGDPQRTYDQVNLIFTKSIKRYRSLYAHENERTPTSADDEGPPSRPRSKRAS